MSCYPDPIPTGLWRIPSERRAPGTQRPVILRGGGDAAARPQPAPPSQAPQAPLAHVCYLLGNSGLRGRRSRSALHLHRMQRSRCLFSLHYRHDFVLRTCAAGYECTSGANGAGPPMCACPAHPVARTRSSVGVRTYRGQAGS